MTGTEVKVADRISDRVLVKDEYLIRIVKTNGGYMKHHYIDESNRNDHDNENDVTVVTTTELSQKNVDISILVDSNKRKFIDIATTDVTENSMNRNNTTDIDATTTHCDGHDDSTNQTNRSKIDHDRDVEVTKKVPMKKRHQTSRPSKEDRLCSYALQDIPCPHAKCSYNHNLSQFLSSKPPDIGDRCYLFDTYGYCSYGITCRFGDSHIDRMTCMNITRSDHQNTTTDTTTSSSSTSGGSKQQQINVLSKEVQLHLRKKRYDYWSNKKKMIVDAVLVHDDVNVVTEVATAADVDVDIPVVINTTIAYSQIKNDNIAASDDSNGNDGTMRVTFGDAIINNNILNEYITDPLSTATSTTPSTTIITALTKNDSSSILSTAQIPMLTPIIPIPSQHHSILVPSICLSTITTLHKPVGEVSLKPYPTKSMKLLDFSDKVFYLFLLLIFFLSLIIYL